MVVAGDVPGVDGEFGGALEPVRAARVGVEVTADHSARPGIDVLSEPFVDEGVTSFTAFTPPLLRWRGGGFHRGQVDTEVVHGGHGFEDVVRGFDVDHGEVRVLEGAEGGGAEDEAELCAGVLEAADHVRDADRVGRVAAEQVADLLARGELLSLHARMDGDAGVLEGHGVQGGREELRDVPLEW